MQLLIRATKECVVVVPRMHLKDFGLLASYMFSLNSVFMTHLEADLYS